MTALPRGSCAGRRLGMTAGLAALALGVAVAVGVALLFIGLTGAQRDIGQAHARATRLVPAQSAPQPAPPNLP